MTVLFWASLSLILYIHIGYPALLYVIGRIRQRPVKRGLIKPQVSVIIAAHNEEANLETKLENTLALRYPKDKLEIIVVSDGSTDQTECIARRYEPYGVICIGLKERSGKSFALNEGVKRADGEILVFTDVGAYAEETCIEELLADFHDPTVGCVSTEDVVQGGIGEGTYVKYEMLLRRLESLTGSCTAVSGSFYGIRRQLCHHFPPDAATDMLSVFECVKRKFRVVSEKQAIARMGAMETHGDEFQRKVRTVLTGLGCLPRMIPLLNPLRYGLFSFKLISHKLLRWLGGVWLVTLFISSLFLAGYSWLYTVAFWVQSTGYALAIIGMASSRLSRRILLIRIPAFFLSVNLSAIVAVFKYISGQRAVTWQPSKRRAKEGIL